MAFCIEKLPSENRWELENKLFRSEKSIACVAETGKNISVLVKASVKRGNVNIYVGVRLCNLRNTLGSTDYCHKLYLLTATRLEKLYSITSASARCEHRVYQKHELVFNALRQLAVIRLRLESLLVSVHSNMSYSCRGKENVDSVYHSESCTEYGNDNFRPAKNVIIWLCSIECCFSHSLDNPDCSENAAFAKDIREWAQIADNLYIWDYVTNYRHYITPFPNFKTLLPNARFFTEHNAIGIYEEGDYQQKENGEFRSLRAYLIGKILWDPYMSEEEYYSLMDDFLEGYYGSGWKYVREYIDRTCERASDKFLGIYVSPQTPFSDANGNIDIDFCTEMYSLWQKAYDVAENDKLKYNCRRSMVQMKFIMLIARSIKNGCVYPEENRALALEMKDIGIIYHRESWTMARGTTESLDEKALTELAPHQWE